MKGKQRECKGIPHALKKLCRMKILPCVPTRYVLAVMVFFGMINVYTLRFDLSLTIVPMTNEAFNSTANLDMIKIIGHQHGRWTSEQQGWILSSFFIGYITTQIPGGYLAGRFGARYVFGIGILMTSVLTLLTPIAAELHFGALIALRILEGMFEGVSFPSNHALWGKWAPPKERSILTTVTFVGSYSGSILVFIISAALCEYGFAGGWPSVFYVFGTAGIVWFVFWLYFGFSSPDTHPRITEDEKKYIQNSIAEEEEEKSVTDAKKKVPWLKILSSPAVWAITVAHFCNQWGGYTLLTCIPSFFRDVLNLSDGKDLIQNGVFSAIPYIALTVVVLISGLVADILRIKCLPTVIVRKLFTAAGFLSAAAGLVAAGYLGSSKLDSVFFLTFSVGLSGMAAAGFNINHVDIAPQYAGVLMGITNLAATIPGIIGPLVAKSIAHKPPQGMNNSAEIYLREWREVFIIAAEIYVFGAVVYLILGRGERQTWAGGKGSEGVNRTGKKSINAVDHNGVNMELLAEDSEE